MFTGLITDQGEITSVTAGEGGARLEIKTQYDTSTIDIGASIACDGCCLTAVALSDESFVVDVSRETLDRTTLGDWGTGDHINLERSLKLGDEMGGHLVSGHVDCTAEVISREQDGESVRFMFRVPTDFARFIAEKGSVAVDGVSLTVNEVGPDSFGVNIIPHTCSVTTFGVLNIGNVVNIEIDMLARYVARLLNHA
ncbi:MAG: riboflavin synthase [Rhodospirillaceae bacterium]|jgi:riboflavin synthase|nr:riboflavin synthase [Rhodospirillaceae bacterium]MBT5239831.1 riboflavin synthase [Rhodospirillaceae bacterium]MBT5567153.1 riboflavin synthase [Rhodospirillaceae bacterium]MBT6089366.1 riboflavin synthase [Rhodospirillaceae bacterium]